MDAFGQRLADQREELLKALHGAILADPQQPGAALLDLVDQGQVFVAFGILDFVDADRLDQAEMAMFEAPGHHIFDCVADLVPAGAERDGSFLPGQFARPVGEKQHVDLGELVLADCPRQFLNAHAAGQAIDAPHAVK